MSRAVFNWVLIVISGNYVDFGFDGDNKKCKSCLCGQWQLDLCMYQDSMCSWTTRCLIVSHCQSIPRASKSQVGDSIALYLDCFLSSVPCPLSTVLSMWQVSTFSLPFRGRGGAHSWVARICHLWAQSPSESCQATNSGKKILYASGTQPPLCKAVWLITCTRSLIRKSLSWFWFYDRTQ